METKSFKTELLVGLFLLIGLGILGGLILKFTALSDTFKETYPLSVSFRDATGVTKGAPVVLGGAQIGSVRDKPKLNDNFTGVVVDLDIFTQFKIPENSTFRVETANFMGDAQIKIVPPEKLTGRAIVAGTDIDGIEGSGLSDITDSAQEIALKTQEVLNDVQLTVRELTDAVEKVKDGFLTQKNMESFSKSLELFSDSLERLDTKVLSDENTQDLRDTIADLRETGKNLKESTAKISPAVEKLEPAIEKLGPAIDDFREVASTLDSSFESVDDTVKSVKAAADEIAITVKTVRSGDGVLPTLLSDSELRTHLRLFAANLKEHGILRYKDDSVISPGGTVMTSDGRPSTEPTHSKTQRPPTSLRSNRLRP